MVAADAKSDNTFRAEWLAVRANLPGNIHFGTSSWNYPGWRGIVYDQEYRSESAFSKEALIEYSECFDTVGVDSFFYSPPKVSTLERYCEQVSSGFRFVSKVWEEVTVPRFATLPRYGTRAGSLNEHFLNAELFKERVLSAYYEAGALDYAGPFVFQFQRLDLKGHSDKLEFVNLLSSFFGELPPDFQYAVEIRNPELLCREYFEALASHAVTHCFNHWTGMPPIIDQMRFAALAGGVSAPLYLSRVLTPLQVKYGEAVKRFEPYDSLKNPIPQMRNDIVRLVLRGIERSVPVYVLVNNRSEGCAPRTILDIGKMILEGLSRRSHP